ncbi:hypothetical protein CEP51_008785 [Fusarium floridanum]|uniref:Zn(2)-C6 fungal-type domain-containing protein n=1 Tax=Fusarium floridanum TaxID=1325733 RepID=A0A428RJQ1_9HYPO|nr:hypothetical protein CEP51_008785 [Fusarium floridanum]
MSPMNLSRRQGVRSMLHSFPPLPLLHNVVVGFSEGFQDETVTEELHGIESVSAVENLLIDIVVYAIRHVKCDNTRPCNRCARNGVECLSEWIRFKHQPPKIRLSTAANATSNEYKFSDDQTWCSLDGELEFVDEGKNLQSIYQTEDAADERGESSQDDLEQITPSREEGHDSTPDQQLNSLTLDAGSYLSGYHDSTSETSWPTDLSNRLLERPPPQQNGSPASGSGVHSLGDALPLPPIDGFSPLPTQETREHLPPAHHHTFTETPVYHDISVWPLKDPTEAKLMRYFIEKIARRFDLCDPERHFALVVPWRAAFCPPLLDAALALSARCLSRTTDFDSYISNRYYQRCLNSLISTLGIADALKNQDLFAAVVLLRTLEEIDGPLSGADSQSHLLGGHLFASASASEHSSILWSPGVLREPDRLTSLRRAALLVAFRQEVYMAFACQRPVLPAFYLPDLDRCLDNPTDDGTWTNRILLHLVDTLKFCFGDDPMSPDQAMEKHNELVKYAEEWYTKKPPSFNALFLDENTERQLAPDIWILSDAAATGLLNYHLLRILLLSFDPHTPRVGPSRARFLKQQDRDIKGEVKTCIGLAEGNPECAPHFVLASLGIALAGDRFEERWEKDELMRFLKRAESLHGWSTLAAQRHLAES